MSTRYNLTHPEEDAFATDKRTGKEVRLKQKIKGTGYWIAEEITKDFWEASENDPYIIVCEYELDDFHHF